MLALEAGDGEPLVFHAAGTYRPLTTPEVAGSASPLVVGRAQREQEDHQRRDGHDPRLAADDRQRDRALAALGSESKSRPSSSRSAAPARAPSARSETHERQHPVQVVEPVGGLAAREQQDRAERRPGGRPRPGRPAARTRTPTDGLAAEPRAPPQTPATRFVAMTAMPTIRWTSPSLDRVEAMRGSETVEIRPKGSEFRMLMRKITM